MCRADTSKQTALFPRESRALILFKCVCVSWKVWGLVNTVNLLQNVPVLLPWELAFSWSLKWPFSMVYPSCTSTHCFRRVKSFYRTPFTIYYHLIFVCFYALAPEYPTSLIKEIVLLQVLKMTIYYCFFFLYFNTLASGCSRPLITRVIFLQILKMYSSCYIIFLYINALLQ